MSRSIKKNDKKNHSVQNSQICLKKSRNISLEQLVIKLLDIETLKNKINLSFG